MKKLLALLVLLPLFANAQPAPPNFAPFWRTNAPSMSNATAVVSLLGFVSTNMTSLTNGNWLTNLNASTAFGSGVIPQQFIPGVLSSNVASGNSVAVTTNANGVFTFNVSSNYFYMLTNLNATQINIAATNAFGGGTFNYLAGNGGGLSNIAAVTATNIYVPTTFTGPGGSVATVDAVGNATFASVLAPTITSSTIISATNLDVSGMVYGNGSGLTNVMATNVSLPFANTNVLVLTGFGAGFTTILNAGPGPVTNLAAANGYYFWSNSTASYKGTNGFGVVFDTTSALPWLTNAVFPLDGLNISGISTKNIVAGDGDNFTGTNWLTGNDLSGSQTSYLGVRSSYQTSLFQAFTNSSLSSIIGLPQLLQSNSYNGAFVGNLAGSTNLTTSSWLTNSAQSLTNTIPPGVFQALSPVPVLGWNSWLTYGATVTQSNIISEMLCLATNGLVTNGWTVTAIDDGWAATNRSAGHIVSDSLRFPSITNIATACHTNGMMLQLYTAMTGTTCAGKTGSGIGSVYQDVADFISWGVQGVKLDKCGNSGTLNTPQYFDQYIRVFSQSLLDNLHFDQIPTGNLNLPLWHTEYTSVDPNKDGGTGNFTDFIPALFNSVNDWEAVWCRSCQTPSLAFTNLLYFAHKVQALSFLTGPGHVVAPINLVMNPNSSDAGWGANTYATNEINVACLLPVSIYLDSPAAAMQYEPAWFTNRPEVWSIQRDPLVLPSAQVSSNATTEVWARWLKGNRRAIGLVNKASSPTSITVNYNMLGDASDAVYTARDPWGQTNLLTNASSFTLTVPATNIWMINLRTAP